MRGGYYHYLYCGDGKHGVLEVRWLPKITKTELGFEHPGPSDSLSPFFFLLGVRAQTGRGKLIFSHFLEG